MMVLSSWLWIVGVMLLAWLIYWRYRIPGVVDAMWSVAIMVAGVNYLGYGQWGQWSTWSSVQWVMLGLLLLWGLRLSGYLFITRVFKGHVDRRYQNMSSGWRRSPLFGFLINYQFQGVLAVIMATPFWLLHRVVEFTVWQWAAMVLILVGVVGEVIADMQLQGFKRSHRDSGKLVVCAVGLWQYSRHPNYFFEWLVWVGFAVAAWPADFGWLGLVAPGLLFTIMWWVTIPLTEQASLASRGAVFAEYQRSTSRFFPWPSC